MRITLEFGVLYKLVITNDVIDVSCKSQQTYKKCLRATSQL